MNSELTQQPLILNSPSADTLVMLVRNKRAHLALLPSGTNSGVNLSLCEVQIGGEVLGVVDSADLPTLQDLALCTPCLAEFMSKHRDRLLSQQTITPEQSSFGSGISRALANQMPLF
ncbi:hypothetical protein ABH908_000481 [Pseudomonas frederiksbergensis]|uniref:hypothetical protein n=1 Tax=Pseudomonas TaxID=286 RepID=UPI003D24CF5C